MRLVQRRYAISVFIMFVGVLSWTGLAAQGSSYLPSDVVRINVIYAHVPVANDGAHRTVTLRGSITKPAAIDAIVKTINGFRPYYPSPSCNLGWDIPATLEFVMQSGQAIRAHYDSKCNTITLQGSPKLTLNPSILTNSTNYQLQELLYSQVNVQR